MELQRILKDENKQREFDELGYTSIDLLKSVEVDKLLAAYAEYKEDHEKLDFPFISTSHSNNQELITAVDAAILKDSKEYIGRHFINVEPIFSNFLIKRFGEGTQSDPHQDASFVDERKYTSFSIWIALEDVSMENGCMSFVPKSHLFPSRIRPNTPSKWAYETVKEELNEYMQACPLKKGQAAVFSHHTIHGSYANFSHKNRLAAVIAMKPKNAQLYHYHLKSIDDRELLQFEMSKLDYLTFVKEKLPAQAKYVGKIPYDPSQVSSSQLKKLLKITWMERLKSLFK